MAGSGGSSAPRSRRTQDPPIHRDLSLSLKDVLYGTMKKMLITRRRADGSQEEKILNIDVHKGWKAGTRITFPREGDDRGNNIPADIIFTVKDRASKFFRRDGADVRYTAKIGLRDALCGFQIQVPTIDGRKIPLRVAEDCIIKPGSLRRIGGQGLPYPKEPTSRGDIIVEFEIVYPDEISPQDREVLRKVLPIYKPPPITTEDASFSPGSWHSKLSLNIVLLWKSIYRCLIEWDYPPRWVSETSSVPTIQFGPGTIDATSFGSLIRKKTARLSALQGAW